MASDLPIYTPMAAVSMQGAAHHIGYNLGLSLLPLDHGLGGSRILTAKLVLKTSSMKKKQKHLSAACLPQN